MTKRSGFLLVISTLFLANVGNGPRSEGGRSSGEVVFTGLTTVSESAAAALLSNEKIPLSPKLKKP